MGQAALVESNILGIILVFLLLEQVLLRALGDVVREQRVARVILGLGLRNRRMSRLL